MEYTIKEIEACKTWRDFESLLSKFDDFDAQLAKYDASELRRVDKLLLAAIRSGNEKLMKLVMKSIVKDRNMIDWMKRFDLVSEIVDVIKANIEKATEDGCEKRHGSFLKTFIKTLKAQKQLESNLCKLFEIIEAALKVSDPESPIHSAAYTCVTQFPWREQLALAAKGTVLFAEYLKANPNLPSDSYPLLSWNSFMIVAFNADGYDLTLPIGSASSPHGVSSLRELYAFVLPQMSDLFNFYAARLKQSAKNSDKKVSRFVLATLMQLYLQDGAIDTAVVKPVIGQIVELWNHDDELQRQAGIIVVTLGGKEPALLADYVE